MVKRTRPSGSGVDTNGLVAGLLSDLAAVQSSKQSGWGYKRAAATILGLDAPIESMRNPDGTLRKISNVGPSSLRVISEVLDTGGSPTVEAAVARSGQGKDIEKRRALRHGFLSRAQVVQALGNRRLKAASLDEYRGDLQMHSTWSDGSQTLEAIVRSCLALEHEYAAVTDHSYGLPIAGGMSMDDVRRQHEEIHRLNTRFAGRFRIVKGIEANIQADGSLDLTADDVGAFELVIASPHSALRSSSDQTARMLAAVAVPGVHILGHPRGRRYGVRPGVSADWPRVFAEAARREVAIEIDGYPDRQDIDSTLASAAMRAGCLFALDSDAHSAAELPFSTYAVAHARLAGIPADRILNCWSIERLLGWLKR